MALAHKRLLGIACGKSRDQGNRLRLIQGYRAESREYLAISFDIRRPLKVNIADQSLDVDNVRHEMLIEVQDGEIALHRCVRADVKWDHLHTDVGLLSGLGQPPQLGRYYLRPCTGEWAGRR